MPVNDTEVITVSNTPIGITASKLVLNGVPKWYKRALLSVELGPIRVTRKEGDTPSNASNNGFVIPAGTVFEVEGIDDLINMRMIKSDAADAKVFVELEQS